MKEYKYYLEKIGEYGVVKEVKHPIVIIEGLPHAKAHEIVMFETGELGEIYSIDRDIVEVLILSRIPVRVNTKLVRTDQFVSIQVGNELLGSLIDPLGNPLSRHEKVKKLTEERELDQPAKGIFDRVRVKKPLLTGVALVDMLIPLGKGQKELVVGDRKTGKSAFLLTTMKRQIMDGVIVVYGAIGRKKSEIKRLEEFVRKEKLIDNMVIVATNSYDSPSLIYMTPYVAMTIAEYFRDQGKDVLVVLDDLSNHAKFHRELALLSKRFPGRDSYPGDIFYTHAKLLERAGNYKHPQKGEVSITCLPVAETIEGDLTGYIVTNLMGMTDGHIFFDSNIYYKGRRPAINIPLSVTRVGRQAQGKLQREINHDITAFLSLHETMQNFSHFGAELSGKVKNILRQGDLLYQFFEQHYTEIIPEVIQLILFGLIWSDSIDENETLTIEDIRKKLTAAHEKPETQKLFETITTTDTFYNFLLNMNKNREALRFLYKDVTVKPPTPDVVKTDVTQKSSPISTSPTLVPSVKPQPKEPEKSK